MGLSSARIHDIPRAPKHLLNDVRPAAVVARHRGLAGHLRPVVVELLADGLGFGEG